MMRVLWSLFYVAPLIALSTVIHGTASMVISWFDSDPRKQNLCERSWANNLLWIAGVKVTVEGLERLKPGESYVFASNHLSYLDTPVVLARIPAHFRFLAKSGLFRVPFMGWHLSRAGHISVPLDEPRAALKTLSKAAELLRAEKISLLIFPEGGRSETGVMQEFKDGAAYLAIKGQVPLVPIVLIGVRDRLPMHSLTFSRGPVRLIVSDPIPTAGLRLSDRAALTQTVRDRIAGMLENKELGEE